MTNATFSVGEVAIIHSLVVDAHFNGTEVEIVGPLRAYRCRDGRRYFGYRIRHNTGEIQIQYEKNLKKKPAPREDLKVVRWDECPWRPETIHV